jgi:hypothetical protein
LDGRNLRMDLRYAGADTNRIRALAKELVGLQPDIILVTSTAGTVALQRETRTIPIVFAPVETAGRSLKVVPIVAPLHSDTEIETAIVSLGREPGGGLVVMPDNSWPRIARRSYRRRPETTYRRSIRVFTQPRADLSRAVKTTEIPRCSRLFATPSWCYPFGRALEGIDGVPSPENDSGLPHWGSPLTANRL